MKTKDTRKLSPKTQEAIRIKAVDAVLSGMTQTEVAQIFGVARQSLNRWVQAQREGGWDALKAKKRGRPEGGLLKGWQASAISRMIRDKEPDQYHFPFHLWTREGVALLIESKYGIRLSVWTVSRYLRRWGYTPQKPVRRAYEQDPQRVGNWLKEEYPAIVKKAKAEDGLIYWGDEMGLRSDHNVGRTWAVRGQTPVVKGTGKRFGCNMISAVTNRGHLNFMVFETTFTNDVFIEFLQRLVRQSSKKVFLIVDGHPVHRSTAVKKWLKKHEEAIRLYYLPPYSPELNPDEMLNQDVKSNAVGRKRARDKKELLSHVRGYLRMRQAQPDIIRNLFLEKHVLYAA